jgi:hypothetical protein
MVHDLRRNFTSIEILKAEKPKEGGVVGPELYLRTVDGWGNYVSMARLLRTSDHAPQLMGQVNGSKAAFDIVGNDLVIRAVALPGWTSGTESEPPERPTWWVVLGGLIVVTALGIVIKWAGSRRAWAARGAKAKAHTR